VSAGGGDGVASCGPAARRYLRCHIASAICEPFAGRRRRPSAKPQTSCPRTVRKWVERYRREGLAGLQVLMPAASAAANDAADGHRGDRTATPPALDGKADRCAGRRLASHCGVFCGGSA
jgi:hypothetical protein